jgi:hypothetical protein
MAISPLRAFFRARRECGERTSGDQAGRNIQARELGATEAEVLARSLEADETRDGPLSATSLVNTR